MDLLELDFSSFQTPRLAFNEAARIARGKGFPYLLYAMSRQTIQGTEEVLFSTYPAEWMPRYIEKNYRTCDPVLIHSMQSNRHVLWSPQLFEGNIKSRVMYNEAREIGIKDGVVVPVHSADGSMACVNFACPHLTGELNSVHVGELYIIANFLHDAILKLCTRKDQIGIHLTSREKEALRWTIDGKTSWEISKILKISERTALYHLTNAMEKLKATNRVHAVAKAISLKLV